MITVTGTIFAVVLAFVIFAAFETYDGARTGAQSEAAAVLDMGRTAAFFPPTARDQLPGDLVWLRACGRQPRKARDARASFQALLVAGLARSWRRPCWSSTSSITRISRSAASSRRRCVRRWS
jgi:hypothetical protein